MKKENQKTGKNEAVDRLRDAAAYLSEQEFGEDDVLICLFHGGDGRNIMNVKGSGDNIAMMQAYMMAYQDNFYLFAKRAIDTYESHADQLKALVATAEEGGEQ
jgi:hypothetical protein